MGRRRRDPRQLDGVLILDKPGGPTSAACLTGIKRLGQGKIGHAGTLDPMATGVLVVLLGQGTKLGPYLTGAGKTYSGQLRLGLSTDTYDIEGKVQEERPWRHLDPGTVAEAVLAWRDETEQVVPPVSAAKHEGRPLYALARAGEDVPVKVKSIEISRVEVLSVDLPLVSFRVGVSAGAYIRSLVHSLGMRLGCLATLTALTREASHPFDLGQAHRLDEVLAEPEALASKVIPLTDALPHWPRARLTAEQEALVKNGVQLPAAAVALDGSPGPRAMLLRPSGEPLALAELVERDGAPWWAVLRGLWQDPAPQTHRPQDKEESLWS
ncbi:MAG: tRNA pseudouridine(55) synthase TruB [Thermodesulfobacteriota bacterium]